MKYLRTEVMHYDVKYNPEKDCRKACYDVLDFVGPMAYKTLVSAIKQRYNPELIHMMASLAGVEGYPIKAMIERYGNKKDIH